MCLVQVVRKKNKELSQPKRRAAVCWWGSERMVKFNSKIHKHSMALLERPRIHCVALPYFLKLPNHGAIAFQSLIWCIIYVDVFICSGCLFDLTHWHVQCETVKTPKQGAD